MNNSLLSQRPCSQVLLHAGSSSQNCTRKLEMIVAKMYNDYDFEACLLDDGASPVTESDGDDDGYMGTQWRRAGWGDISRLRSALEDTNQNCL